MAPSRPTRLVVQPAPSFGYQAPSSPMTHTTGNTATTLRDLVKSKFSQTAILVIGITVYYLVAYITSSKFEGIVGAALWLYLTNRDAVDPKLRAAVLKDRDAVDPKLRAAVVKKYLGNVTFNPSQDELALNQCNPIELVYRARIGKLAFAVFAGLGEDDVLANAKYLVGAHLVIKQHKHLANIAAAVEYNAQYRYDHWETQGNGPHIALPIKIDASLDQTEVTQAFLAVPENEKNSLAGSLIFIANARRGKRNPHNTQDPSAAIDDIGRAIAKRLGVASKNQSRQG